MAEDAQPGNIEFHFYWLQDEEADVRDAANKMLQEVGYRGFGFEDPIADEIFEVAINHDKGFEPAVDTGFADLGEGYDFFLV